SRRWALVEFAGHEWNPQRRVRLRPARGSERSGRRGPELHRPVGLPRLALVRGERLLPGRERARIPTPDEADLDRAAIKPIICVEGTGAASHRIDSGLVERLRRSAISPRARARSGRCIARTKRNGTPVSVREMQLVVFDVSEALQYLRRSPRTGEPRPF